MREEVSNGPEAGERLKGRIIFVWPIALCAHASPARSAEFGSFSDHKTSSRKEKSLTSCPAAECGKEFEFEASEIRAFEVPVTLFERRHFYRSELQGPDDSLVSSPVTPMGPRT